MPAGSVPKRVKNESNRFLTSPNKPAALGV